MKYEISGHQVWATDKMKLVERLFSAYTGNIMLSMDRDHHLKKTLAKIFGFHREDGPAVIFPNGDTEWWVKSELHRIDGPSLVNSRGAEWWLHDVRLHSAEDFQAKAGLNDSEMITMTLKYGAVS